MSALPGMRTLATCSVGGEVLVRGKTEHRASVGGLSLLSWLHSGLVLACRSESAKSPVNEHHNCPHQPQLKFPSANGNSIGCAPFTGARVETGARRERFNWAPNVINQDWLAYALLVLSVPQILALPSGS